MLAIEPTRAALPPDDSWSASPSILVDDPPVASDATPVTDPTRPAQLDLGGMRVRIGRLGIDLPVLAGDTHRDTVLLATPNGAAFLLPSSSRPGSGGNSYIYAHARVGMFLALWEVRLGDLVEIDVAPGEVLSFVVSEIHPRVAPTDARHTLPTDDERITLQTSTGPRGSDPRFVVVARRAD